MYMLRLSILPLGRWFGGVSGLCGTVCLSPVPRGNGLSLAFFSLKVDGYLETEDDDNQRRLLGSGDESTLF